MQQLFEPPCNSDSIEIGDHIQVLDGEHAGKRSIIDWFAKGETSLWFCDVFTANTEPSIGLLSISVPIKMIQRMNLLQTIQFTKERGYDIRLGDTVSVVRGPEFGMKWLVHHVDFPNASLVLLCDGDKSLVSFIHFDSNTSDLKQINVPIKFIIKLHNASVDQFKKDIGQEVYIIGGPWKGYQGTLDSVSIETCTVAVRRKHITTLKLYEVVTR
jgi:ribosomal protein L24